MRIPRFVVVNGEVWTVTRKPLKKDFGICIHSKRAILIDSEAPVFEQEETFFHELMHACFTERWSEKREERFIRRLSPRLLQALKGLRWVR